MKKFLSVLMIILFTIPAFGQWSVGPRLGMNFSTCSGKYSEYDNDKKGWIPGIVVGGVAERQFTDKISGVGELLFLTSGAKYTSNYEEDARDLNQVFVERYGKVQIPILAKITFITAIHFYAIAGPYLGFALYGHYVDKSNTDTRSIEDISNNKEKIPSDAYKTLDFGLYLGGGVQKQLGPGILSFDLRFGLGLIDTYQFPDGQEKPEGYKPYKNRNISMTFAYMFDLQK